MDRRSKAALLSESHFQFEFSTNDSAFFFFTKSPTTKGNTTRYQLPIETPLEGKHLDKLSDLQESFRTEPCRSFRFPSG